MPAVRLGPRRGTRRRCTETRRPDVPSVLTPGAPVEEVGEAASARALSGLTLQGVVSENADVTPAKAASLWSRRRHAAPVPTKTIAARKRLLSLRSPICLHALAISRYRRVRPFGNNTWRDWRPLTIAGHWQTQRHSTLACWARRQPTPVASSPTPVGSVPSAVGSCYRTR